MTPGDHAETDLATMRALHRESSDRTDAAPDPSVRAAVLSAATEALADRSRRASGSPFGVARWPLSMAAVLVVSVMAGLVATRGMRDEPERVAPVVAAAPQVRADEPAMTAAPEPQSMAPAAKVSGDRAASPATDEARARAPRRPKTASPQLAPSNVAAPPAESAAVTSTRQAAAFAERLDASPSPPPAAVPSPPAAAAPRQVPAGDALRRSFALRASSEPPTPEAWVERIVALRAADRADEADRELAALRLRYPDFVVPRAAVGTTGTR